MAALTTPTLIQPSEVVNGGVLKASPLNARFDVTLIAPHIADAEQLWIVPALGLDFYAALIAAKDGAISNYNTALGALAKAFPDADDLSVAYEALWFTHLRDACAWAVYYEALPFIAIQVGSNGPMMAQPDHFQNAGTSGVKFLQDTAKRRLQAKLDALGPYLCTNATSLTGFDNSDCPDATCGSEENPDVLSRFGLHYVTARSHSNDSCCDDEV